MKLVAVIFLISSIYSIQGGSREKPRLQTCKDQNGECVSANKGCQPMGIINHDGKCPKRMTCCVGLSRAGADGKKFKNMEEAKPMKGIRKSRKDSKKSEKNVGQENKMKKKKTKDGKKSEKKAGRKDQINKNKKKDGKKSEKKAGRKDQIKKIKKKDGKKSEKKAGQKDQIKKIKKKDGKKSEKNAGRKNQMKMNTKKDGTKSEKVEGRKSQIKMERNNRKCKTKTKKKCLKKGGICKKRCKRREKKIKKGCKGNKCECCLPAPCKVKRKCRNANGFCVKDVTECLGQLINKGCKGRGCQCCVEGTTSTTTTTTTTLETTTTPVPTTTTTPMPTTTSTTTPIPTTTTTTTTTPMPTSTTTPMPTTTSTTTPIPTTTTTTTTTTTPMPTTTTTPMPTTTTTEPATTSTTPMPTTTTTATTTPIPTTTTTTTPMPTTTTTEPETTTTGLCDILRTTICPDGSRCHENAKCLLASFGYYCKCNTGYAGDGADCGTDGDGDSWPEVDLFCCKVQDHCSADNCPGKPNSGQEDSDFDGIGDACDTIVNDHTGPTQPPTPAPNGFCIPRKPHTNCPITSDGWKTHDTDGDGHVDSCDNCPNVHNVDQSDTDRDRVGDACDTDLDADGDGKQDGHDNCINVVNPDQSDVDFDGFGDKCDDDADGDGIPNQSDNCWLVPNPGQEDADNDSLGDVCENDFDGDCLDDHFDICPEDPTIHKVDFNDFHPVNLDQSGASDQPDPVFVITHNGAEVTQLLNSAAGLMFGTQFFHGIDFDGTFFINTRSDDDYAGFIFGYENSKSFYVVMWKQRSQDYFDGSNVRGKAGVKLKRVHSITGPGEFLARALWKTETTTDQVTLLWHDPSEHGWDEFKSYRWQLIHRPHIGLIRFRFLDGSSIIADSGNIYDDNIPGGYLGTYCHSQEDIIWSNLDYLCNSHSVPQEVYDDLPSDKQAKIEIDLSKDWSGTVQVRQKKKSTIVLTEPGINGSDHSHSFF